MYITKRFTHKKYVQIYTVQDISNHINTTSSTCTHPLNSQIVQKRCFTNQDTPGSLLQLLIHNLACLGACTFTFCVWFTVTSRYSRTCFGAFTFRVWFTVTIIHPRLVHCSQLYICVWFTVTIILQSHVLEPANLHSAGLDVGLTYRRQHVTTSTTTDRPFFIPLRDKSLFCGTSPCSAGQVPVLRDKSLFCGTSPYSAGQVPQTLMDFLQMYNDHDRAKNRKKKITLCCWLFISFLAT